MNLANIQISFAYEEGSADLRREIERNVRTLLTTPVGTCPLYREFGIQLTALDQPLEVAKNILAVEIMDAVERWESRVRVTDVSVEADVNGSLQAKVVIDLE